MSEGQYELVMNPEYDDFNLELLRESQLFKSLK